MVAAAAAVAFRLPRLQQRPMHGDEAVHARKFGTLLEKNFYRYDAAEYHGPTLNYLTLIPAWLGSAEKLTQIREFTLRIVPVFFGVLLVLLPLLLIDGLGPKPAVLAAGLTAISPAFIFYSRYYIQEMLLVCFTFAVIAFGWRYTRSKKIKWLLLTGISLGLMNATKETAVIAFASMLSAGLLTLITQPGREKSISDSFKKTSCYHILAAVAAAVLISVLFYSSFFTNPAGIWHSLRAYTTYFNRAAQNQLHIHPWYYYLKLLVYYKFGPGPVWSEALIVVLAVIGFVVIITKKAIKAANLNLLRFIAFYTFSMTVIYSAIPYKTPWCLLGFLHGMILLAAVGAATLIKFTPNRIAQRVLSLLLLAAAAHLAWQGYLGSYKYYADPVNPYVYGHPVNDVFSIVQRIEDVARAHPDGHNMHIQVICPEADYWPLPWYLRSFTKVGWWNKVNDNVPAAPVIITSPDLEPALMKKLYELPPPGRRNLYVPLFDSYTELRPRIELRGFVTKDLWDDYQQLQEQKQ